MAMVRLVLWKKLMILSLNINQDEVSLNNSKTFFDNEIILSMNNDHCFEEEINDQIETTLKKVSFDEVKSAKASKSKS